MSELVRLVEVSTDDDERALLASALTDAPPPGARARLLASLGIAGVASVSAAAHASAGSQVGAGSASFGSMAPTAATAAAGAAAGAGAKLGGTGIVLLVKWVGLAAIGGAIAVGATFAARAHVGSAGAREQSVVAHAPAVRAPLGAGAMATRSEPANATPEHSLAAPILAAGAVVDVAASRSAAPPGAAPRGIAPASHPHAETPGPGSPTTLGDEIASLDSAQQALSEGHGADALAALDAHAKRFSSGALGPEAAVLRIEALAAAGDTGAAARQARAFLAKSPGSPHAARVRSLLLRLAE